MPRTIAVPVVLLATLAGLYWYGLTSGHGRLLYAAVPSRLRISQVYGAGGNEGAAWQADFVELFNSSDTPITLDGWSIEYAPASSANWQRTPLDTLLIAPYGYLLMAGAAGSSGSGMPLPVPDIAGDTNLNATDGKVRLLDGAGAVVDLLGYGDADTFEGSPAPSLSAAHSALRLLGGCQDTDQNGADFVRSTPQPRNSASPSLPCPAVSPSPSQTGPSTETPQSTVSATGRLLISEFLADPAAVADDRGEWIEVVNPGPDPVNLHGWTLYDSGRDHHVIAADLQVAAGGYVILARNGDPGQNGGVIADYVYNSVQLANDGDEIVLADPNNQTVDSISWGAGTALVVRAGASLERTDWGAVGQWQRATQVWLGSAGDLGSPGTAYSPATPTSTATAVPVPTATATEPPVPTPMPTASNTPIRPAVAWVAATAPAPLQIEEVYYGGSGVEFVALLNTGTTPVALTGWRLGDAEFPGDGEGMYDLPAGVQLSPQSPFVIARNGADFWTAWGALPQAQFEQSEAPVPVLNRVAQLASGTFALNNGGDEVVLIDPAGQLADVVVYGDGDTATLGVSGALAATGDLSLQRIPGYQYPTTLDLRHRFLWAPPDPFGLRTLPAAQAIPPLPLPGGYSAVIGSLGVSSTFSPGGMAPPHLLAWAAAATGLHFVAIADLAPASLDGSAPIVTLPAWRWQQSPRQSAIIYGPAFAAGPDPLALLDGLAANNLFAQWLGDDPPRHDAVVAHAGDGVMAAGDAYALWNNHGGHAFLLAGNALPPLPGYFNPHPRYTGLAVSTVNAEGIMAALAQRRGWLTSDPGLALALQTTSGVWMGGVTPLAAEISLVVSYRDKGGQLAGLAIWQDNRLLYQNDRPSGDGEWQVSIPARPGSLIYAVATQLDGDFAITTPIRVGGNGNARLWINEVMPVPISDFNGDGVANPSDEYIELWNAGPDPISLAGWVLEDGAVQAETGRRRFALGSQHFLNAGEYLLLWGSETFIGLNNSNERLRLFDATGALVDDVEWSASPGADRTLSRVPDGGRWDLWSPSPGRSNGDPAAIIPPTPTPPPWVEAGSAAPGTPGGEAVGPAGSVTEAKLAGLAEGVRFVGVVIVPPGIFNSAIYVADPAADGTTAGLGIHVYLRNGDFPALAEGDRVDIQGVMDSFRGEREVVVAQTVDLWRVEAGTPLAPLQTAPAAIGESLEGRLVVLEGIVSGYRGSSFFLRDPDNMDGEPVEIHVRSSLSWRRPFVVEGDRWRVTGIVNQFAEQAPWNGGYRILPRYESDLIRIQRGGE